jgi:hypothetical protein
MASVKKGIIKRITVALDELELEERKGCESDDSSDSDCEEDHHEQRYGIK